jgi:hypothetical protein
MAFWRTTVDKGPAEWTFALKDSEFEEAFSYIWDRNCRTAIAATLGADDTKKVDYIILSGGTCRLGFHEKYLRRDFGNYFRQLETTFINVSGEAKPVAFGLCFQALLDKIEQGATSRPDVAESLPQATVVDTLQEEDLSDYVARNLLLRVHGEHDGAERIYGEAILVRSGTPKQELWGKEQRVQMKLWKKPKRAFRFDIRPADQAPDSDSSNDSGSIYVRHKMADNVEKTIQAGYTVNEDGICQLRFYLAPYRFPHYFEPDKETFKIMIPDLARRVESRKIELVRSNGNNFANDMLLGFDFGTSMSSVVGLELESGD